MKKAAKKGRKRIPFIYDVIKIVESLEKSHLSITGATETVKHENKKNPQEYGFLGGMMELIPALLVVHVTSSLIQPVEWSYESRKRTRR